MRRFLLIILFFFEAAVLFTSGQELPVEKGLSVISEDVIMGQLKFLASDWTEGREAGERGEYLASDYIASILQMFGIAPYGDIIASGQGEKAAGTNEKSYFQNITLLKKTAGDSPVFESRVRYGESTRIMKFSNKTDFSIRPFFESLETDAPLLFAGHGIRSTKYRYIDLAREDIKGCFIMIISGNPKFLAEKMTYSELAEAKRDFEDTVIKMGAAGIIYVDQSSDIAEKEDDVRNFMNMSPSEKYRRYSSLSRYFLPGKSGSNEIPRIKITMNTAKEIFRGTPLVISEYIKKSEITYPVTVPLTEGINMFLKTSVNTQSVAVRNVLGRIEGKNPEEVIVIGAHYDHLGMSGGYIWNGADDNASGTAGVMTLARALTATGEKPDKTIIIALWTAEEKGLLGSRYYVENLPLPAKNIRLNINFDMISRYISEDETKKVTMTYSERYPAFREMTERNLEKYKIDLEVDFQPSNDPPGGSDHRSFSEAGIPVMRFKPGHRSEYHTPYDELETVNADIMEKIIKISFVDLWELANSKW
jgi:hypothetical protein